MKWKDDAIAVTYSSTDQNNIPFSGNSQKLLLEQPEFIFDGKRFIQLRKTSFDGTGRTGLIFQSGCAGIGDSVAGFCEEDFLLMISENKRFC